MPFEYQPNKIIILDEINHKQMGYISYSIDDNCIFNLEHTVVYPEYQGKGIAKLLVLEAISYCKDKGYKINPICSYAVSFFKKNPEYSSILKEGI